MQIGQRSVTVRQLFKEYPFAYSPLRFPDIAITGLAIDSRKVEKGNLFIARRGGSTDGHAYIPDAIQRGAVAVVGEQDLNDLPVPYIQTPDSIQAVTWLAAAFHDWPGRKLTVIGVTGTDGKTTTCNLIHQILINAGIKAGLISTVNAIIGDEVLDTGFHVTTPDAHDVQQYLARMVSAGLTHVVLETTSHGLAQHRVDASEYDIGVVTNITHEHLDQHGSYENYRAAKGRLFQLLGITGVKPQGNPRLAVLNRDDSSFEYLTTLIKDMKSVSSICYGLHPEADFRAENIIHSPGGNQFVIIGPDLQMTVTSPLAGEFNVSNCLAAVAATVRGLGIDVETTRRGIAAMRGIPGRMELIDMGQPFTAIVDFAHTPNALRVAIETAKKFATIQRAQKKQTEHRVIAVFGSAGLRDREKRRMMAETSVGLADISILTAEDPRTESLEDILMEMAAGAKTKGGVEGKTFYRIPDRGEAIRTGIRMAKPGDIVIVCGKGHEQSMCFGEKEYPWDDRTAVRAALAELLGAPGPQMPSLPTQERGRE